MISIIQETSRISSSSFSLNTERDSVFSVVPNFGTEGVVEEKQEDEWDLSGTINQCIQRYAERLTEDQLNEILLGLENGLTEEEVKSYFTFPVEKMNQYRRAYQFMQ